MENLNTSDLKESALSVRNLQAGYGKKIILESVSFDVRYGEIRVILGGSGCGKSTLLNNILGLERALAGQVSFLGKTFRAGVDFIPNSVRIKTGVLFQGGALLSSYTVSQNVALPLHIHRPELSPQVIEEMVVDRLEKVNMLHAYHKLPSELSGGMRKRAALARAIILDPQILFCDEPSAGLDPVTARSLDDLLLELRETLRISIIIVTHELESIKAIGDRILFLSSGGVLLDDSLENALHSTIPEISNFFKRIASMDSQRKNNVIFNFQ